MQDHDMDACCKHCDVGKNKTVVKLERGLLKDFVQIGAVSFSTICKIDLPGVEQTQFDDSINHLAFTAFSPPRFIANRQLLI